MQSRDQSADRVGLAQSVGRWLNVSNELTFASSLAWIGEFRSTFVIHLKTCGEETCGKGIVDWDCPVCFVFRKDSAWRQRDLGRTTNQIVNLIQPIDSTPSGNQMRCRVETKRRWRVNVAAAV